MPDKPKHKSSVLVPLGVLLMLLGVVGPGLLRAVIPTMQHGVLRSLALVSTDLVILGLFLGIGFIIAGNRRNKIWEKESVNGESGNTQPCTSQNGGQVKRPILIYFIAGWSFMVLWVQGNMLFRLAKLQLSGGQDERQWAGFRGLLLILVVWHFIRLIQLRPFNRWLSVVSFAYGTISGISNILIMSQTMDTSFRMLALLAASGLLERFHKLYSVAGV